MGKYANKVVEQAKEWLGYNEADGSHKKIIDIYNSQAKPLPRYYTVKYTDAWCATFVSSVSIKLGYTDIMPTECGCYHMIEKYKALGCWVENDAATPAPGWVLFYDWEDNANGSGDNRNTPDHVGIVEKVTGNIITVIEGNYKNAVTRREIAINGRYIRGYGVPKYDEETTAKVEPQKKSITEVAKDVIAGKYGNGNARKQKIIAEGYNYNEVQNEVNRLLSVKNTASSTPAPVKVDGARSFNASKAGTYRVSASDGLRLRAGASTSKEILETMSYGSKVTCYGYSTGSWLYVVSASGKTGFCHTSYLKKV